MDVGPALEARGLLGTFYVFVGGDPIKQLAPWRTLGDRGHELGNHTLFHPCRRERPGTHPWLDAGFDLRSYTPYRLQQELRIANTFLHLLDGKTVRSYGATCSDMRIGAGASERSIEDLLRDDFIAVRGRQTDQQIIVSPSLNLMNVGHCAADFCSFAHLQREISTCKSTNAWLVYHIHGVGKETKELFIERDVHERLLDYLAADPEDLGAALRHRCCTSSRLAASRECLTRELAVGIFGSAGIVSAAVER